jgi:hypothetical protein
MVATSSRPVGESKLKHYTCINGAELVISPDAEKVASESSQWLRNYMVDSAKESNDKVIFTITLPEGQPADPAASLILQFKLRAEVLG